MQNNNRRTKLIPSGSGAEKEYKQFGKCQFFFAAVCSHCTWFGGARDLSLHFFRCWCVVEFSCRWPQSSTVVRAKSHTEDNHNGFSFCFLRTLMQVCSDCIADFRNRILSTAITWPTFGPKESHDQNTQQRIHVDKTNKGTFSLITILGGPAVARCGSLSSTSFVYVDESWKSGAARIRHSDNGDFLIESAMRLRLQLDLRRLIGSGFLGI